MSCNPAIGGIAKGTVVREVDALGGIMARATDLAMVQFRMLNRGKGAAVWSPRAQCDRGLYRRAVRALIERHQLLHVVQGTVARLLLDPQSREVRGVETLEGRAFAARTVVITSGTFLRGRIHIGTETRLSGGRAGEAPAVHLAEQLEQAGLAVARFKTGTPPRIDGRSVDFSGLERQDSEVEALDYSWSHFWTTPRRDSAGTRHPAQIPCWITYLEKPGKKLIEERYRESAMYGGAIAARGPRYCPSVEDKVLRFPTADRHQIFLEPEGHDTSELYVNGLSTSLPAALQMEVLRTVPGLSNVRMTRAGYAIEYDYFPPTQLLPWLETRAIPGLFLAGQVNGTTGYEEAAGQGAVAGCNAARKVLGKPPVILGRETSYIGVLIDDLVSKGVDEPYRLFTSRSEFRLTVRQDNALGRLAPLSLEIGLLSDEEARMVSTRLGDVERAVRFARDLSVSPEQVADVLAAAETSPVGQPVKIIDLARRQRVSLRTLLDTVGVGQELSPDSVVTADLEIKYAGYFERERVHADRLRRMGSFALPDSLPYESFRSLTVEARQKLAVRRPSSLAQAASIPGVGPNDLQNLIIEVERWRRVAASASHAS
ncbi:MAG: tRNA uridine 5-carboxymethylaminomethyl modification enzyme MnmG [Gemmatimonadaceae bacterium]|nr:tRNA uridine 5-carboxymethylaminomethyl modification enzyme MnmG [Gemmatimonadaceae bacterium]